jgi:hypothetical protein
MPISKQGQKSPIVSTALAALLGVLVAAAALGAFSFAFGPQSLTSASPSPGDSKIQTPTAGQGEYSAGTGAVLPTGGDVLAIGSATSSSVVEMALLLGTASLLAVLAFFVARRRI